MNGLSSHHIITSSIPSGVVSLINSDFKHCDTPARFLTATYDGEISEKVENRSFNNRIQINDHMRTECSTFESRDPLPGYIDDENNTRMVLNPDINKLSSIMEEINKNNGWCPSKPSSARNDVLRQDTRCPCPDFMIYGKCECGLFVETSLIPDKDKLPTKQYSDFIDWDKNKKEEN